MLQYHLTTESEKAAICDWKYVGDYKIYNLPPYEELKALGRGFGNPDQQENYYSYFSGGVLIGFTNMFEEETEVFIGIGVHPDYCGMGYGQEMMEIVSNLARECFPNKPLYLEVRTWNMRAVRCYEKSGFSIDGDVICQTTLAGEGRFYRMVKENR